MKRKMRVIITIVLLVCMFFTLAVDACAIDTAERVKFMLRSQVLFDDCAKLIEAVDTNDASKVFMTILEIYPDLVALAKKSGEEDGGGNNNGGLGKSTTISDGNIITLSAAIIISGAMIAAAIIVVNKKKTAALIAAANEKQNKSSEELA